MRVGFGSHMRFAMLALCAVAILATGWLLTPVESPAAPQGTLRVDVDLVTIEVIAQDKKGTPMLNLKKEDFRIYEDGKQQEIMSFDAVADKADEPMPTSLKDVDESNRRGKVVLILFDDSNITASQIQMSRESAEKYVKQHMRPWDFVGVASYGLSLKILQNLTHDADKVVAAIRQPAMSHAETRFGQGASREDQNRGGFGAGQQRGVRRTGKTRWGAIKDRWTNKQSFALQSCCERSVSWRVRCQESRVASRCSCSPRTSLWPAMLRSNCVTRFRLRRKPTLPSTVSMLEG